MANSVKDAFERAKRALREEPMSTAKNETAVTGRIHKNTVAPPVKMESFADLLNPNQQRHRREEALVRLKAPQGRANIQINRAVVSPPPPPHAVSIARVVQSPIRRSVHPARTPPVAPPAPPPAYTVSVLQDAACSLSRSDKHAAPLLAKFETAGRSTQAHTGELDDQREVVLGMDFGTSCVKAVIGDSALGKAFAVPFCKVDGIGTFLLPSRVCQTGSEFSLEAGTHVYRDLKLSLLANPEDPLLQQRVVAFLALIIRRARGWFLTKHASTYQRTGIAWKLAVGLPSAQHHQTPLSSLFERLSLVAWTVAGASGEITPTVIQTLLGGNAVAGATEDDVEVTVVPEIAAQIYGFVASNSFDKKAANIYLIADVGSGTVDSSLFHVKQGKGGRWDFEFFTSVVEPNGVSNLHRHRVNWWTEALTKAGASQQLVDDLETLKLITDQQLSTPESFGEYFDGVDAKFQKSAKTPDEEFFDRRVLAQVQGKTLWRTWKDNLLPQSSLTNVPFFMCGGGMRMEYYSQLEEGIASLPGYSWLKAERWVMGVPDDLVADGVATAEYDRLSVAYGLSRLEVGRIVRALPQPKLAIAPVNIWRDNYVDKDQT